MGFSFLQALYRHVPGVLGTLQALYRHVPRVLGTLQALYRHVPRVLGTLQALYRHVLGVRGTLQALYRHVPRVLGTLQALYIKLKLNKAPNSESFNAPTLGLGVAQRSTTLNTLGTELRGGAQCGRCWVECVWVTTKWRPDACCVVCMHSCALSWC